MAGRLRGKWREDFAVGNGGKISGGKWREDLWCDMAGRLGGIVSTYLSLIVSTCNTRKQVQSSDPT